MKYAGRLYLINSDTEPTIIQVIEHAEDNVSFTVATYSPGNSIITKSELQFMEEKAFAKFVKKSKSLTEDEANDLYCVWTGQKEVVGNLPFPIPDDKNFIGRWYLDATSELQIDAESKFLSMCEGKKKFYLLDQSVYKPRRLDKGINDCLIRLEPVLPTDDYVELPLSQLSEKNFLTKEAVNELGELFGDIISTSEAEEFGTVHLRNVVRLQPSKWTEFKKLSILTTFFDEDLYAKVKVSNRDYIDAITGKRNKCTKRMKVYPLHQNLVF